MGKQSKHKMVIVMRKDLAMTKGKYVGQGSHASDGLIEILREGNEEMVAMYKEWKKQGVVKVVTYVKSLEDLHFLYNQALEDGLPVKLVTDLGLTMFKGKKTDTCIAVFGTRQDVDGLTGHLNLL